jgi:hypothetical protein
MPIGRCEELNMLDKPAAAGRSPDQPKSMKSGVPLWPLGLWGFGASHEIGWNGKVYESLARLGTEWVDFVNRRLKEDINLLPRLAACSCAAEASKVYAEFWRNFGEDYAKEFAEFNKLSGELATSSFTLTRQTPRS